MPRAPAYLQLYRESARNAALVRLGPDPFFGQVAAELLRDSRAELVPGEARYRLVFGAFAEDKAAVSVQSVARTDSLVNWRSVVDLVPATFKLRHPPSYAPADPTDPDYCYLDLISAAQRLPAREALGRRPHSALLAAALLSGRYSPTTGATFTVTVGVPAGVRFSDKLLAHVSAFPGRQGAFAALEALRWIPCATRVGADDPTSSDLSAPPGPAPAPAVGTVTNPLVRRFSFTAGSLEIRTEMKPGARAAYCVTFDPLAGPVRSWARWLDCLRWDALQVNFVPLEASRYVHLDLHMAWYPAHRPAPENSAALEELPGRRHFPLAPAEEQVLPQAVSVPCTPRDGVSFQVVPPPQFGGTARLALVYSVVTLPTATVPAGTATWDVDFELVADARV